ncbi:MAG TPA: tripartite tricarboxylate transporter substrate binding protein [Burkholderiales bacterium]|jgi:tripartite-type tricarboxylate transporter receptor subunit TctC|nr:tripartite tricarboxylate transporter substrate binding protein [Burkholderiales bacterium]
MNTFVAAAGVGLLVSIVPAAQAQDAYPTRAIRIVVPTAPGGGSDSGARLIGQELTKRWGRPVVVENRAGAGTIIGSELVARAPPDGYTLLSSPSTLATNPSSYKKMPYDALRDFVPITQTLYVPNLIVIHASLPVKNVKEMIAFAKARPGEILYASAGHGTNPHLTMELFASMAGIKLVHVPYKGSPPGIVDLVGGRVAMIATSSLSVVLPHVKSGRLRALGVTTSTRVPMLPGIPTIAESGVPGYEAVQWAGLVAPLGTPRPIIDKLHKESTAILRENTERLAGEGFVVVASTPEEFAAFMKSETTKWGLVAKAAGVQPE